jgi:hypothetical protein
MKGILHIFQQFQEEETLTLQKIGAYGWIEETHVPPVKISSVLESAVSYTLFPFEIWVNLSVSIFSGRNIHFKENKPAMQNWRNTCKVLEE